VVDDEASPDRVASTVIAVFGDIRAWKGRPGFSAKAKAAVKRALDAAGTSDCAVVMFSHPRLASDLETAAPILCAWGGEAVMQRAAARVMLRELRAAGAARNIRSVG
jgi:hypothetical protein